LLAIALGSSSVRSTLGGRGIPTLSTLCILCSLSTLLAASAIRGTVALSAWEDGIGSLDGLSSLVVGLGITETASTVTLLRNDSAGAFAGFEATARRCAVGVGLARASDELGARGSTGNVARSDGESEVKGNKGTDDGNGDHDDGLEVQVD
jgi:hypothetical protein